MSNGNSVPRSDKELGQWAAQLDRGNAELEALKTRSKQEVAALEARFKDEIDEAEGIVARLEAGINSFLGPLEKGRDATTAPNGFVVNRTRTESVVPTRSEQAAVRALKRRGLHGLIRRKVSFKLKKQEIKDRRHLIAGLRSIRIIRGVSIKITPPHKNKN